MEIDQKLGCWDSLDSFHQLEQGLSHFGFMSIPSVPTFKLKGALVLFSLCAIFPGS